MTYSAAREQMAETMDRVCEDHAPVLITRKRDKAVVMISLQDYDALEETAYLLRSPRNAKRMQESLLQFESESGRVRRIKLK